MTHSRQRVVSAISCQRTTLVLAALHVAVLLMLWLVREHGNLQPYSMEAAATTATELERTTPMPTMTAQTTLDDVTLSSTVVRHPERIEVHYVVTNHRSARLAVLNRLFGTAPDGGRDYSPNHVYVELDRDTLHLIKGALDTSGSFVEFNPDPGVHLLEPGSKLEDRVIVPIPVKVRQPFQRVHSGPGRAIASKKALAHALVISVGVLPVDSRSGFYVDDSTRPDFLRVYPIDQSGSVREYQTMLSTRFSLEADLPVLDYVAIPRP